VVLPGEARQQQWLVLIVLFCSSAGDVSVCAVGTGLCLAELRAAACVGLTVGRADRSSEENDTPRQSLYAEVKLHAASIHVKGIYTLQATLPADSANVERRVTREDRQELVLCGE
jgi:hypothetical protein